MPRFKQLPTCYDVAKEAGVDQSVVSKVMNNKKVSAEAHAKVMAAITRIGYRRNKLTYNEIVRQIEEDWGFPIADIMEDLVLYDDYMGKRWSRNALERLFEVSNVTITKILEQLNFDIEWGDFSGPGGGMPDEVEDAIWVKYGITPRHYYNTRARWLTFPEMAFDLNLKDWQVQSYFNRLISDKKVHVRWSDQQKANRKSLANRLTMAST